ncbi:hypothetical protein ACHEXL_01215 [Limnohabitans sp. yimb22184]|uniref:hypothetical protein n=1 Tax=Limnohabitans sp. YIMB22184 TaxID=3374104 RepID=UPI003A8C42DA
MFARVTSIQIDPAKLPEMRAAMPAVGEHLKRIPGIVECKTCWDETGKGLVFAIYASKTHADNSADTIRSVWGGLMAYLSAPPSVSSGTEVIDLLQ